MREMERASFNQATLSVGLLCFDCKSVHERIQAAVATGHPTMKLGVQRVASTGIQHYSVHRVGGSKLDRFPTQQPHRLLAFAGPLVSVNQQGNVCVCLISVHFLEKKHEPGHATDSVSRTAREQLSSCKMHLPRSARPAVKMNAAST